MTLGEKNNPFDQEKTVWMADLKTLYGPMNLAMSFLALPLGSVKFFVDKYTKSFGCAKNRILLNRLVNKE